MRVKRGLKIARTALLGVLVMAISELMWLDNDVQCFSTWMTEHGYSRAQTKHDST